MIWFVKNDGTEEFKKFLKIYNEKTKKGVHGNLQYYGGYHYWGNGTNKYWKYDVLWNFEQVEKAIYSKAVDNIKNINIYSPQQFLNSNYENLFI